MNSQIVNSGSDDFIPIALYRDCDEDISLLIEKQQTSCSVDSKVLPSDLLNSSEVRRIVDKDEFQSSTKHTVGNFEAVSKDITTAFITQRIELENKTKTIELLQQTLNQQRQLAIFHAKEIEKDFQKKLGLHRQQYEGTIERHQSLINQLIEDKQLLSDKCESLLQELNEVNVKFETKISALKQMLVMFAYTIKFAFCFSPYIFCTSMSRIRQSFY